VVGGPDATQLARSANPTGWTIADDLSRLGPGTVILEGRLDDGLAGVTTPDDAAQTVWDEWNAKAPRGPGGRRAGG